MSVEQLHRTNEDETHSSDFVESGFEALDGGHEEISLRVVTELGSDAIKSAQLSGAAEEPLSETYFHGSNYHFKLGENITPSDMAIVDAEGLKHASATTNEEMAWSYAESAKAQARGRERVYRVVPHDGEPVRRLGPQRGEVNSPAFTTIEEINIKPGQQGTFPEIDWSEHSPYVNANHPNDIEPPDELEPARVYPSPIDQPFPELGEEYRQQNLPDKWKSIM